MAGKIAIAVLLALTPLTAVLVLGWIARLMRRETAIEVLRLEHKVSRTRAIAKLQGISALATCATFPGWWRGILKTAVSGLKAVLLLGLLLLPFGMIMMIAWWAGWENSFNKGYEQAWVGPAIAISGIVLGTAVLLHWPMILARFAAEGRLAAALDIARTCRLIRAVRWRYAALGVVSAFAAAPLFVAQILPTFVEQINPAIIGADAETVQRIARRWHFLATLYMVVALFLLRRWAARIYARAVLSVDVDTVVLRELAVIRSNATGPARTWRGGVIPTLVCISVWLAFFAALFVAQFVNHAWWNWANHPLLGLPWVFRVW